MTGQTPSDEKVSMEFRMFGNKSQKNLTLFGFRPVLYIEILEAVTCPNNFPQDLWKPTGPELTSSTAIKIVTANGSLFEGFVAIVTDLVTAINT